jgi:diguanylate cyclase (GGDEF)-like protein
MSDPAEPPVSALSGPGLQAAIAQVDQAFYNHDQWHRNLVRILVSRLPPDAADLQPDAHVRCRFGQWLDSSSPDALRASASFVALSEAHRSMHGSATRLLQRVEDNLPIPPRELDQFSNLLDHMRLELESLRHELTEAARNRDPLTDARNRASMLADLREQHALVRRGVQECSITMIDVDHFKAVNDTHGHAIGDVVLRSLAHAVQDSLRPYDRFYRYGGEEFLLCSPQTSLDAALDLAERLRQAIIAVSVPDGAGGVVEVTASFGVASLTGVDPVEASIQRADDAMYRAKKAGRNRTEVSGGSLPG